MKKIQKVLESLKNRIDTVELNGDLIEKAIGRESYLETLKIKDELKILVEAYENQREQVEILNKKVMHQKGQLKVLYRKQGEKNEANI